MQYENPVIKGFYPDPSIVRVDETNYYMATSSFEYFPGVPIFHSVDLVNWQQIGHALTRKSQLDLSNSPSSSGIYAPTLRYHQGTFYLITTDVRGIGNFYVTAKDPRGPWSEPIKIPYGNIDPSLLFDEDGKVYVTVQNGAGLDSHVIQYEIDPLTGEALTKPVRIFDGDGGEWTEAPHLYNIHGLYYLLCASGGTGLNHRAIIARSDQPYGPFELCEMPILSHNQLPDHPIQALGHADIVEDNDGNWWAVFLATRPVQGKYTIFGRETFLAPIEWTEDGWPIIDPNKGTVNQLMESTELTATNLNRPNEFFTDFKERKMLPNWYYLRYREENSYLHLCSRNGWLRLDGNKDTLNDQLGVPAFIAVPQTDIDIEVSTEMLFSPEQDQEEAGLVARLNERAHYDLVIKRIKGKRYLLARQTVAGDTVVLANVLIQEDQLELKFAIDQEYYYFLYKAKGKSWVQLAKSPLKYLSVEENGGTGAVFTGVMLGLYATGNGRDSKTPAYFNWFKIKRTNQKTE